MICHADMPADDITIYMIKSIMNIEQKVITSIIRLSKESEIKKLATFNAIVPTACEAAKKAAADSEI